MNVETIFKQLPTRYQLEEFLLYLSEHPGEFPRLFNIIDEASDSKVAFRTLWACEKVSQRWPEWWTEDQKNYIRTLVLTSSHTGMLRLGLSILNSFPPSPEIDVELLNALYERMLQPSYPPGVQAQAMRLLFSMVKNEEDLLYEFRLILEDAGDEFNSAAFRATRKNLLKHMRYMV